MSGQLEKSENNNALSSLICQRIAESSSQRITFADYMDLALYHPQQGYYASSATKIGAIGDFFTSPHLGADFGELLAEQFVQFWHLLDCPSPFTLVEMGAGQGLLAKDILSYAQRRHPDFFAHLDYVVVERAHAHVQEQQRQLQALIVAGASVSWRSLEDWRPESVIGCFFSNELVDALPVHQVVVEDGQLREVYVSVADESSDTPLFTEAIAALSTPALADYFDRLGIDLCSPPYGDGYRTEVNLAALDWITSVATRLKRGYVLTIDYGYSSDRYYHPARTQGTLQCYYRHAHHSDPYCYVGRQDITAHVDFTALQQQGELSGLQTVGLTKQGLFLMGLGLGDRLAAIAQLATTDSQTIQAQLQRREALHLLANPMGLGNFGVLIQAKGVERSDPLSGLMSERF